jgi:carbon monoxide dehydrogenase subunit G
MGTYEQSTPVNVAPQRLYEYLANVDHLPEYMPRIKEAHMVGDADKVDVTAEISPDDGPQRTVQGQAWLEVRDEGRRLEWGAPGPHDYRGELEVEESASGESKLTVRLHTERGDRDEIDAGLIEAVERIRTLAEDYGVANP